jgi:L-ribulose-5-phosphate 3-epimerase
MRDIDRRQLLGIAGSLCISAGSARAAAPPRPAPRARLALRNSLGIGMIAEGASLTDKFRLAAELGFDGIELYSPADFTTDDVLAAKEASGLEVSNVVDSVHWQSTLGDADEAVRAQGRQALERALADCKAWGGSSVLLVPAVVNKDIAYDHAWTRSLAEIRRVLPRAEELGVPIAVENVWNQFLLSPLEAARYVDELASPRLGWHMDVGNVVNYGWPEQWIRVLGARIVCLHVKEFSRKKRDAEGLWKGFEVELGEGDCDWPAVTRALDEVGYSGWAVAEVGGGDRARLADVLARMKRILGG